MQGRYFDGLDSTAHAAEVRFEGGNLIIEAGGQTHVWSGTGLFVDVHADQARVSRRGGDARLVMTAEDWNLLAAGQRPVRRHSAAGGQGLIIGLAVTAAATALVVFVGIPMASGPLARATPLSYEAQMGESYNAQLSAIFPACQGEAGQAALQGLADRLSDQSGSPFPIRARVVRAPMVNAFALPGGYIMVTGDLIEAAESPDEVAGVLAHEIAHVERRHVMQSVWRSLGAGMLLDLVVGGGTGAGQQAVLLAGQASELSFGRQAETEADDVGRGLLHQQGLSSRGMGDFFERMAEDEIDAPERVDEVSEWWMTHPNTERRIAAARAAERGGEAALTEQEWETLRATCGSNEDEAAGEIERPVVIVRRPGNDPMPGQADKVGQH
jgi:Zn-dependent protease with chaperone function